MKNKNTLSGNLGFGFLQLKKDPFMNPSHRDSLLRQATDLNYQLNAFMNGLESSDMNGKKMRKMWENFEANFTGTQGATNHCASEHEFPDAVSLTEIAKKITQGISNNFLTTSLQGILETIWGKIPDQVHTGVEVMKTINQTLMGKDLNTLTRAFNVGASGRRQLYPYWFQENYFPKPIRSSDGVEDTPR